MKRSARFGRVAAFLALAGAAWAQTTRQVALSKPGTTQSKAYRIAPQTFRDLERRFDTQLQTLSPDINEPTELLGSTRGVYLDGYGVVFTAEVSLVRAQGLSPFLREIPKELAARVHAHREERLPLLKAAMDDMIHKMAMTFMQIPPDQHVVLAVRLLYASWESSAGMPAQVMMSGTRDGVQAGEIKVEVQ